MALDRPTNSTGQALRFLPVNVAWSFGFRRQTATKDARVEHCRRPRCNLNLEALWNVSKQRASVFAGAARPASWQY